jgi:hypothetical protein
MKTTGFDGLDVFGLPTATTLFFPSFILTFLSHIQSTAVNGKQAYNCIFFLPFFLK